ncbi:copper chaperone PCu(A)C [Diaphorobacter sp. JS3051]|uniref:copper chaperone PCu(A)C n=1 Tax=Diaphorobacter sp. JS3051 TaxID=2792224 RepID=UPI0018CAEBAD|nr:copper chaperone PCu(A)C [Diaphorobacter sp. JS3051]QPN33427.1 copper chaperone PCu(A)C [Diaphorobacter sp. JS3051]
MPHPFRRLSPLLTLGLVLAAATGAWAQNYQLGPIRIDKPWTRATPPAVPTGAGYLSLTNEGREADRLIEVTSPIAGRAEIHTMETADDVARMRWQKDGVALPPGQTIEFKPGSTHIMFLDLAQPIRPGTRVPLTLVLERAGKVEIELVAAPMGTTSAPDGSKAGVAHHGKH